MTTSHIQDKDRILTYAQLNTLSTSIASTLPDAQNCVVAVLVPRTVDIIIGLQVARACGGVFMPMDDAYPTERINYMLRDADARYLLTTKELWNEKGLDFKLENVRFFDAPLPTSHTSLISPEPSLLSASLILYTSGTTGNPKGVVHTTKSIDAIVKSTLQIAPVKEDDNIAIFAGFTFIASQFLIYTALQKGASLHIIDEVTKQDIERLHQYLKDHHIDYVFLPPTLATVLVEEYDMRGIVILSAGDKLRNFKPKYPCQLYNMYGSTEGVIVIAGQVQGDEETVPLGKPMEGIELRIVDENLKDVSEGENGELIYAGDIQAKEYLNLPEQTAEKWFVDTDGRRWFRMGDRVRRTADGTIYYVGRTDNMVKIRGFRVETGEVERQISAVCPRAIFAVVMRNVHGIDHLVCFYESSESINEEQIKNDISLSLASYMIPDIWVRMKALPRNANGKVVRNQLPTPTVANDKLSTIFNEVEMRVVEAAKLIIGQTFSLDDNFFDCGGTSLGAIKLATQLKTMGIRISASKILELKYLRAVAEQATVDYERMWTPEQYREIRESFAQRGETIQKVLPLTTEHEDLLYRYLMHSDSTAYRNVFILKMDSHIKESVLRDAIDHTSEKNEVLRSAIAIHHRALFQQVVTDRCLPLDSIPMPEGKQPLRMVKDVYQQLMHLPYDPEISSIIRFAYIPIHDGTSYLLCLVHNVSASMNIARRALFDVMTCLSEHNPDDASISSWRDLIELALSNSTDDKVLAKTSSTPFPTGEGMEKSPLIRTYSPLQPNKPAVTFVHTGNTGSDAYYHLADKIGPYCSFAVLEPYNLFHSDDIQHGIKAIARKYIEILRNYQSEGPYILGGWCYGGVVAHEMACQMQEQGLEVKHLFMFDSHALAENRLVSMAKNMFGTVNRKYFEECPLFEDLRGQGLLDAMVRNCSQVTYDLAHHVPSHFEGSVTYFKPMQIPLAATGKSKEYWEEMMKFDAGNFENYCNREKMEIIHTPHEHDLMMDDESLAITVPKILGDIK